MPKTDEARRAAALKYNVHPTDYKTYPDDGTGYGDYPKLPVVSGDARDPHYPYDFPEVKRNFNEPVIGPLIVWFICSFNLFIFQRHVDEDIIGEDRYNFNFKPLVPMWMQILQFVGAMIGTYAVYLVCEKVKFFVGTIPKQYPAEGKVHYTFEPQDAVE